MEQVSKQGHWESRVECATATTQQLLAKRINELYSDRFIVGTQIFHDGNGNWTAFVYWKERQA